MTIYKSKSRRFRHEKWFWVGITIASIPLRIFVPEGFQAIADIVITIMSSYALVLTLAGAEQAAEAKEQAEINNRENP